MRSASRLRLLKSLGGGKEDKAVGGGSLGSSSFVFFRRQTTPFKGFLSRSLRTTSNARDDDDEKGAGKMLFTVSLCLRFRRNDALQFEGMRQPKQRFGSAFVVIIVFCVTRIIRGVFVLHFVPHFSTNEYLKSVEIYDLSLTLLLSLTL